MGEKSLPPRFISTRPGGEDLFDSGSQKRIAESIASHIKKEETDGLKLIGLDGEYGVGKSNVIEMIRKQLIATHHLFVYDAWSHQEDLQRRSFLEELTTDLEEKEVFKSGKWGDKLKLLLAKTKETKTLTVPRLSPSIVISFFVVVLLPVAKVVSDATSAEWAKLLIAGSPFILGVIVWLLGAWLDPEKFNITRLLYIYKDKDLETTTKETIAEKEPSVSEFRKWMDELSKDLNKNLIIVIDNMERLTADKVPIVWSLVHTFFSERHYKGIYVIVPFDRSQIREVFDKSEKQNGDKTGFKGSDKTNHFIEKTFPVLFTVPPPVLTDWNKLFHCKYHQAFGDLQNGEYNLVKNVFDLYADRIIPRKIISFLNDLVAINLAWQDRMPLRYAALFALNKERIVSNPFREILDKDYLSKAKYLFDSDDTVADHIAALAFNIPVDMARQVTISREVLLSIREANIPRLIEMSVFSNFWEIVNDVYTKDENIDIVPAVTSLCALDEALNKDKDNDVISDIWDTLAEKQIGLAVDEQVLTDTHKILIEKARATKTGRLVRQLTAQFRVSRNFKGPTYFTALNDLDNLIKEKEIQLDLPSMLREVNLDTQNFIPYASTAKEKYAYFKVVCNNMQLDQYLAEKAADNLQGSEILPYVTDKYEFPGLKNKLEGIITSGVIGSGGVDKTMNAYKAIFKSRSVLPVKFDDPTIRNLFALSEKATPGYYELCAMILKCGADFKEPNANTLGILRSVDPVLINEVAARIEYYISFGDILKRLTQSPEPLLIAVAKKLIENDGARWELDIAEILPIFVPISEALGSRDLELFVTLEKCSEPLRDILNTTNIQQLVPDIRIYRASQEASNELSAVIHPVAIQYVEDQEPATYNSWFADENSYGFQLSYFLLNTELLPQLPNKMVEAYKEVLNAIARADAEQPTSHPDAWEKFYQAADKDQVEGMIKNIRDAFINTVNIVPGKFLFFEKLLRLQGGLPERSEDTTRRILTPVATDKLCLAKIIEHRDFYLGILSHSGNFLLDFMKEIRKSVELVPADGLVSLFSQDLNKLYPGQILIKKAKYYADDKSVDVTKAVKERIESERDWHFKVGNDLASRDPKPDVAKKLDIEYEISGKVVHGTIDEGDWLNVPFD